MHARRVLMIVALGPLSLGCFSSEPTATAGGTVTATVMMTDQLRFAPATVTIHVGEAVRWQNVTSAITHTVTADPGRAENPADVSLPPGAQPFNSGAVTPGQSFQHTFTVAGTYRYFCIPHETLGMLGTVVVEP